MNLPEASFTYATRLEEVPAEADLILTALAETPPPNGRRCMSLVDFDNINFRIR